MSKDFDDFLTEVYESSVASVKSKGVHEDSSWKEKCRYDLGLFCKHYFPDVFTSDFCALHEDIISSLEKYLLDPEYSHKKNFMVRAAPRGHAKTTLISFGAPLWCSAYGYRKNILLVSDTNAQAENFIGDIKAEIEDNEEFIKDFGNLMGERKWNSGEIVTANDIHIMGKGAGQKLRGIGYKKIRPDLVIIDDLENDVNVQTQEQREKLFSWFMRALLKVGSPVTTFIYIGTVLSYDSLLNRVLTEPQFSMWNRKIYKAVTKFSSSPLWNDWEKIIMESAVDEDNSDNIEKKAHEFYDSHKEEMLAGVECLWPAKSQDYYYDLMLEKVMDPDSFNSEEQNDPLTDEFRDFKDEWIQRNYYEVPPELKEIYGAVDPTIVSSRRSDTSAIIILGKGIDNKIYVLEADVKKRSAEQVIDDMYRIIGKYYEHLDGFVVETNAMQQFFSNTVKQKFIDVGLYVKWIEIKHPQGTPKDRRIKSMIPYIRNDMVKFNREHKRLLSQLRNYGRDSDDGPDALQMALEAIMGLSPQSTQAFSFGSLRMREKQQGLSLFARR